MLGSSEPLGSSRRDNLIQVAGPETSIGKVVRMAKFLFVYRSDENTFDEMAPKELHRFHAKWQTWITEGMRAGWMLDASTALKTEGRRVNANDGISDGPLVEAGDVVRGYVNVEAETLDSAAELAKGCPVLLHGGSVEVRPFWRAVPGIK